MTSMCYAMCNVHRKRWGRNDGVQGYFIGGVVQAGWDGMDIVNADD